MDFFQQEIARMKIKESKHEELFKEFENRTLCDMESLKQSSTGASTFEQDQKKWNTSLRKMFDQQYDKVQIIDQALRNTQSMQTYKTKQLQTQIDDISVKLHTFASIDHVDKLKTIFLPKFEFFGNRIDDFLKQINLIKEGVKHIDNQLNVKANKSQLALLKEEITSNFVTQE